MAKLKDTQSISHSFRGLEMKRKDQQEVERIVHLWLDYYERTQDNDEICKAGKSMQGEIETYHGDIPRGSDFKPETVAARAERLKIITTDMKWAKSVLFSLCLQDRMLITNWVQLKKKVNPISRQLFTMREVGLIHGLKLDDYRIKREAACEKLLIIAEGMPARKKAA